MTQIMTHAGRIAVYLAATGPSWGLAPPELASGHIPTGAGRGKTCNYLSMSIAISEEHRALAQTVAGLLTKHQSRAAARSLLEGGTEQLPAFWAELSGLGLLGLHVPEELGGSGFGLAETLVVAEQMGRHLAPGPFVPTVIASAVLAAAGPDDLRKRADADRWMEWQSTSYTPAMRDIFWQLIRTAPEKRDAAAVELGRVRAVGDEGNAARLGGKSVHPGVADHDDVGRFGPALADHAEAVGIGLERGDVVARHDQVQVAEQVEARQDEVGDQPVVVGPDGRGEAQISHRGQRLDREGLEHGLLHGAPLVGLRDGEDLRFQMRGLGPDEGEQLGS